MVAELSAKRRAGAPARKSSSADRITIELSREEAAAIVNAKNAACAPPSQGYALMWLQQRLQNLLGQGRRVR